MIELILGAVAVVMAVLAKMFAGKAAQEKQRADTAEVKNEHIVKVLKEDVKIVQDLNKKLEKAQDEVKKSGTSSELSNPNEW